MLKNQKGVTLLELIIAIGILALVIGPYLNQFVKATEIGERSERIVRAEYAAQKKLEEIKLAPDPNNNGMPQLYEGFTVTVNYSNKTTSVNSNNGDLNYFDHTISPDIIIVPSYDSVHTHLDFQTDSGASKGLVQNLDSDQTVTLLLEETPIENAYKLKYKVDDGLYTDILPLSKGPDEEVVIRVNASQTETEDELLTFVIYNASGNSDKESPPKGNDKLSARQLEVYEFDDDNKNYSFERDISNTGEVNFYLKLNSETEETVNNDLDYYWVYITVENSRGELIYDLYSSVRKK
ncbi:type IV pilus modification PilV family protein [Fusibacter sp. JL216-2]|uniref:type IV pilus modification PilV family protein n=1 Tax=Fusibacter sp. JL216-2 TaxID=3071453 RepID=UPI003D352813